MPTPSQCADLLEQLAGRRVAVPRGLGDQRPGDGRDVAAGALQHAVRDRRVGGRQLAGLADQDVARGVLLPAAAVAALAAPAVRHDLHVAVLPRDAEPAALQGAVDDHRAADAGAEVDAHQVRLAAAGAEPPLGPDRGVGVVLDHDRQPQPRADGLAQRLVAPGQVRGEQHVGAVGVDEAGRADADRVDLVALREVEHGVDDGVLDDLRALAAVRGLPADLVEHLALVGDDAGGHLRAADVDPDREQLRRSAG